MARKYTVRRFTGTEDEVREQWLESRKSGIGGSDAAVILGLSPFKSPLSLWLEKTGRVEADDISGKEAVYWGNVLEDVVAREFSKNHPSFTVKKANQQFVSTEYPWMLADVDRVILDGGRKGILECKTASAYKADDWKDGIPIYYLPQVVHYLAVTGYEFAYIAALVGGQHYVEYKVDVDDEDISAIVEAEAEFWNDYVLAGVMPELVGGDDENRALAMYYGKGDPDVGFLDDETLGYVEMYEAASEREKQAKADKQFASNHIKKAIGESGMTAIESDLAKVTWNRAVKRSFDTKRFASDYPDLYEVYVTEKEYDAGIRVKQKGGR